MAKSGKILLAGTAYCSRHAQLCRLLAGRIKKWPRIVVTKADDSVYCRAMDFCHQHNLVDPSSAGAERRFGIRITLPADDTIRKILGHDWQKLHWYSSESERDSAFDKMSLRHGYYRESDKPTQVLEKIVR